MNPRTAEMLLNRIRPIIRSTVPRVVKPVDGEDHEELVQDALATAAEMLESIEKSGRKPIPRSIAYYSIQKTKSGRRSYGGSRNDVLSPGFRLDNEGAVESLDAPVFEDCDDSPSVGDTIADRREDPSSIALRRIDWEACLSSLGRRERQVLESVADGQRNMDIAARFKVSPARMTQLKREIGTRIKSFMGEYILNDIAAESPWERDVRCIREKQEWQYASQDFEPEAA